MAEFGLSSLVGDTRSGMLAPPLAVSDKSVDEGLKDILKTGKNALGLLPLLSYELSDKTGVDASFAALDLIPGFALAKPMSKKAMQMVIDKVSNLGAKDLPVANRQIIDEYQNQMERITKSVDEPFETEKVLKDQTNKILNVIQTRAGFLSGNKGKETAGRVNSKGPMFHGSKDTGITSLQPGSYYSNLPSDPRLMDYSEGIGSIYRVNYPNFGKTFQPEDLDKKTIDKLLQEAKRLRSAGDESAALKLESIVSENPRLRQSSPIMFSKNENLPDVFRNMDYDSLYYPSSIKNRGDTIISLKDQGISNKYDADKFQKIYNLDKYGK